LIRETKTSKKRFAVPTPFLVGKLAALQRPGIELAYFTETLDMFLYCQGISCYNSSSSFNIVTCNHLRALASRRGLGIFVFTTASRTPLGPTQLPIQ
jgi:hypothetical protein